jgi:predicted ATP-dependent endonuclease of OLD family
MKLNENKKLVEDVKRVMSDNGINSSYYNNDEFVKSFIDIFDKTLEKRKAESLQKLVDKQDNKKAQNWSSYIKSAIKTGLESPTPYKVIPYKNGIGIKKIEFFKPIKNGSL